MQIGSCTSISHLSTKLIARLQSAEGGGFPCYWCRFAGPLTIKAAPGEDVGQKKKKKAKKNETRRRR